ncbi:MAG: hypothetical protein ACK5CW_08390 [Verrucomicrobiota bacterium]
MLVTVNILFSFALEQNYLPAGQPTVSPSLTASGDGGLGQR